MIEIPDRMNAAFDFVDANVKAGRGDKVAIHYVPDGSTHTYTDVLTGVNRAGNALRDLGLDLEQRVMLLLLDSPDFVYSFFGAIKIGAVPVPTNTRLAAADYEYLLNDSRARMLIVSAPLLSAIEPIRERLPYLQHLIVAPGPDGGAPELPTSGPPITVHSLPELCVAASSVLEAEEMSRDDPCLWLYSSGTTGFPKGAVHLQHDMLVCARTYAQQVLRIAETDTTFSVAKLFFAYGLGNALYFPFGVGASTVLYPGHPGPAAVFDVLLRYRPSIFYSVPTGYAGMLAYPEAPAPETLSSLRACVSAGEALPATLFESWQKRYGQEILDGIGSTEVLHTFISNRPGEARPGSSGQVVRGYEARIVDGNGDPVAPGEVGDLLIKGDSICACYWNRDDQTKATIEGAWIRTGDKYIVDEDEYYWYQGRADDMLKVGGIWVSPFEVEIALLAHDAVVDAAVVGAENEARLVKPKAFVVLRTGVTPSDSLAEELKVFVRDTIAPYKYPRWIEFVDELPKTATGKIQRYRLR
ncbi:MAG TPA: benzoate-CoA ligase family protein [Acidobacteriota bacterium]|nr:benzoate-CoA ligase family protein [Acidobacteriota bacterium]